MKNQREKEGWIWYKIPKRTGSYIVNLIMQYVFKLWHVLKQVGIFKETMCSWKTE